MPDRRPVWLRDAVAAKNRALELVAQCEFLAEQAPNGGINSIRALLIESEWRELGRVVRRMERRYLRESLAPNFETFPEGRPGKLRRQPPLSRASLGP